MDLSHVERLKEQRKNVLRNCEDNIAIWKKHKTDYETLKQRLQTLPHELSYDITVPFGPNAFTMGQLVHTNEIMVLLGENWFASVSAKQAEAIAERRITKCVDMLKGLEVEREQYKNWLAYIDEVAGEGMVDVEQCGDEPSGKKARIAWRTKKDCDETSGEELIEIFEEYDEEKEKAWREQHSKNVKAYRQKIAKERKFSYSSEDTVSNSEDECMSKLEKLALAETPEQMDSLESAEISEPNTEQTDPTKSAKFVPKGDDQAFSKTKKPVLKLNINCSNKDSSVAETESGEDDGSKSDDVSSNLENSNSETHAKHVRWQDQSKQKVKKITFKHSKSKYHSHPKHQFRKQDSSESEAASPQPLIKSPSDIYKHFGSLFMATSPKSILKVKNSSSSPEGSDSFFAVNEKVPHNSSTLSESENIIDAFTGEVIENSSPIHITEKRSSSSSRKVSHFKSSRKSKKRLSH